MDAKPSWVPDWAWDEYLGFIRGQERWASVPSMHGGTVGEHMKVAALAIFLDKGCEVIWAPLAKRRAHHKRRWVEQQKGLPDGYECGSESIVVSLLFAVAVAMRGPPPHALTPASQRKERGNRIARLADELWQELAASAIAGWGLPVEVDEAVERSARASVPAFMRNEEELHVTYRGEPAHWDASQSNFALRAIAYALSPSAGFPALQALKKGGLDWANSEPTLYRPNDPNAARLYFVRAITFFFKEHFGGPLREVTAAITRCLFEGDIDGHTVAKIAP